MRWLVGCADSGRFIALYFIPWLDYFGGRLNKMHKLKYLTISIILVMLLSLTGGTLSVSARPLAATLPVPLGAADNFAVLAGSGITNSTGPTKITGDVGTFPTPVERGFSNVTLDG